MARTLLDQGGRFLLVGAANTLLSFALFWLLLRWLPPQPAYAIAFAAGILFAYLANSLLVFGAALRWTRLGAYPLIYVVQYGVNAVLLQAGTTLLGWPPPLALAAALCITVPLSFLLNRKLLGG
jgi:putative flippase GtrA